MSEAEPTTMRRLYRSRRDKVIAGVCGGLGGYLSADPVIVRVVWLALVLFGGAGLLAYIIAWILIPEAPPGKDAGLVERRVDGSRLLGIILIVVALVWIASLSSVYFLHGFPWKWLIPMALVALGAALILRPGVHSASRKQDELDSPVWPGAHPEVNPRSEPSAPPSPTAAHPPDAEPPQQPGGGSSVHRGGEGETNRPFDRGPLRRSRDDRVLGGVCGGVGLYLHVDSTWIRLGWALLTVVSFGIGAIAYLAFLFAVPEGED